MNVLCVTLGKDKYHKIWNSLFYCQTIANLGLGNRLFLKNNIHNPSSQPPILKEFIEIPSHCLEHVECDDTKLSKTWSLSLICSPMGAVEKELGQVNWKIKIQYGKGYRKKKVWNKCWWDVDVRKPSSASFFFSS